MKKIYLFSSVISLMLILTFLLSGCTLKDTDKEPIDVENNQTEVETTDTWGIQLSAKNITPKGLTLECKQLDGEPTGDLQTGSYYLIETYNGSDWLPLDYKDKKMEVGWTAEAWIIPMDDTVKWEVDWEWLYGELPDGKYRIGKEIIDFRDTGDYDKKIYYANFEVVN